MIFLLSHLFHFRREMYVYKVGFRVLIGGMNDCMKEK
jgi:hypothetical protein